ncbi:TRAP transporter large permease subunit [Natrialba aegyptia]|uniref:TRAP dicarboxylate transporter subunit DctM n=1 Tax=Natrialba aegyptia DSM 13077 TaxID=1227491 RepID=M0AGZ8_9EURY|nr:TRAP transporter large permease subunit [Natrialba aegyptia]ELY97636.1 TRAP dicarboxylate transporter subunit DctM [Natrialba aegyptia DSM 13077]
MILALMVGTLTPPFGALLFVLEKVTDASLEQVIRSVVPFYIPICWRSSSCSSFPNSSRTFPIP